MPRLRASVRKAGIKGLESGLGGWRGAGTPETYSPGRSLSSAAASASGGLGGSSPSTRAPAGCVAEGPPLERDRRAEPPALGGVADSRGPGRSGGRGAGPVAMSVSLVPGVSTGRSSGPGT